MRLFGDLFKPVTSEVSDYELKPAPVPDNIDVLFRSFHILKQQLENYRQQASMQGKKKLANNIEGQIRGLSLAQTMLETFFYRD